MSQHHDPVHPDSDHLTAEMLADLDLGLLDDASAEHARHHLATCSLCTELHADLASLISSLNALQDHPTEPMPEGVWSELEQALASEPVRTPEGAATVVPLEATRKRRFGRPGIGVVAGAAAVALAAAIVIPTVMSSDRDDAGLGARSGPIDSSSGDLESAEGPVSAADFAATHSGTTYDQDRLESQVTQLVAARTADAAEVDGNAVSGSGVSASPSPTVSHSDGPTPSPTGPASTDSNYTRPVGVAPLATDPAAAQACLADLDASNVVPLAIDIGVWQGRPAAVIVLPLDDPTLAEVWVINPKCDMSGSAYPVYFVATISR